MKQIILRSLLVLGFTLCTWTAAGQTGAARPPGRIVAARVVGDVRSSVQGVATTVQNQMEIPQAATVTTAKASSVVLLFSNGATVQLGAETTLIIEKFLADPFGGSAEAMAASADEPTVSNTQLRIVRGEIVGQVKHLRYGSGSTYQIETPVGAAGIRGTTFQVSFVITGNNIALFSLGVVEGDIGFIPAGRTNTVDVRAGTQVTVNVSVSVDPRTGAATIPAQPEIQTAVPLTLEVQSSILQVAQDAALAAANATGAAANAVVPPPPPPAPDPRTTPGDGRR